VAASGSLMDAAAIGRGDWTTLTRRARALVDAAVDRRD